MQVINSIHYHFIQQCDDYMLHNSVGVQVLTKPIPNMQNIQDVSVTLVARLPSKMKTRASLAEKKPK